VALRQFAQIGACAGALTVSALVAGCGAASQSLHAVDSPVGTHVVHRVESATPAPTERPPTPARRERALRLAVAKLRVAMSRVEGSHMVTSAKARALDNRLGSVEHGIEMLDSRIGSRDARLEGSVKRLATRAGVDSHE
jgi:hypothetical protein